MVTELPWSISNTGYRTVFDRYKRGHPTGEPHIDPYAQLPLLALNLLELLQPFR